MTTSAPEPEPTTESKLAPAHEDDANEEQHDPLAEQKHPDEFSDGDDEETEGEPAAEDQCQFCLKQHPDFVDEKILFDHYCHECPMLTNCQYCDQMIEKTELDRHLEEECEGYTPGGE